MADDDEPRADGVKRSALGVIALVVVAVVGAFAIGRYTAPTKVVHVASITSFLHPNNPTTSPSTAQQTYAIPVKMPPTTSTTSAATAIARPPLASCTNAVAAIYHPNQTPVVRPDTSSRLRRIAFGCKTQVMMIDAMRLVDRGIASLTDLKTLSYDVCADYLKSPMCKHRLIVNTSP